MCRKKVETGKLGGGKEVETLPCLRTTLLLVDLSSQLGNLVRKASKLNCLVAKEGGNRETGRLQGGGNAPWLENHAA